MPLSKQNLAIPFSVSLDTKTDPLQLGNQAMLSLKNAIYSKDKRIEKRNGFGKLTALPADTHTTTLTTLNDNLTAIGNSFQAYSSSLGKWFDHGRFQPVQLSVLPLVRSSAAQRSADVAVANGMVCSSYQDSTLGWVYQVSDATTAQLLIPPTVLPTGALYARTFVLGAHFIITFVTTTPKLQYIAIPLLNITMPTAAADISAQILSGGAYDAFVYSDRLYIAWAGSDLGGAIRFTALLPNLSQLNTNAFAGFTPDRLSVTADPSDGIIWVSFTNNAAHAIYAGTFDSTITPVLAPTSLPTGGTATFNAITSLANNGIVTVYTEVVSTYSNMATPSNFLQKNTCTEAGTATASVLIVNQMGLGAKAFTLDDVAYLLAAHQSPYQSTYFLIDDSGNAVAKLAYSNGGGYVVDQVLSSVYADGSLFTMGYLFKDLLVSVSKDNVANNGTNVYTQTGVNLATFDLSFQALPSAEIGGALHVAGGFLWMYDGSQGVEHSFHLWPEYVSTTTATTTGHLAAQVYYYVQVYAWTDAAGNIHRSAPSVPHLVDLSGSGTSTNKVTLTTDYLPLTYKESVRLEIYRWSTAQQSYYLATSITSPIINSTTASATFVDAQSDATILGQPLLYTTGGVVENIAAPACKTVSLFKSRLIVIPSEDSNTPWYSKQVIEATPVEMSDLFTLYTAPTIGSQGSTGPTETVSAMDDKLIFSKANAFYYVVGNGPDNTGANNDFSDPIFITSAVGCSDQQSIVMQPGGLMFQSDKGVWILGRDLSTQYIGAPVEDLSTSPITSALGIPGTNQIRFTPSGTDLVLYDYFFQRWSTFTCPPSISGTLYNGLHTYLDKYGNVLQETLGLYQDNGVPVLLSFTTSWFNLAGLQGLERIYYFYLLGTYISAHTLQVDLAYEYQNGVSQRVTLNPSNYAGVWGNPPPIWGQGTWGGPGNLEQWRIFPNQQKLQSLQITVQELYDISYGDLPGAGLSFSGLNLVAGIKKGFTTISATQSAG